MSHLHAVEGAAHRAFPEGGDVAAHVSSAMAADGRSDPAFSLSWSPEESTLSVVLAPDRLPLFTMGAVTDFVSMLAHLDAALSGGAPVRYVVYSSPHEGAFSFGGDLAMIAPHVGTDSPEIRAYCAAAVDMVWRNWRLGQDHQVLTVALVGGAAIGGGLECALSCDLIFASDDAVASLPEIAYGFAPGMGAYSMTAERTSPSFAKRLLETGRTVTAAEGHGAGLFDVLAVREASDGAPAEAASSALAREWSRWRAAADKVHPGHVARARFFKDHMGLTRDDLVVSVGRMADAIAAGDPAVSGRLRTVSAMLRRKYKLEAK